MMLEPHSSCRYAVLAQERTNEPTHYAVVAVHGLNEAVVLASVMTMGTPVTYGPAKLISGEFVKAMCRNSADAHALVHRWRTEDREANR